MRRAMKVGKGGVWSWLAASRRRAAAIPASIRAVAIAVMASTVLAFIVERFGLLERLELDAFDALVRAIPDKGPDDRLLIVSISASDTARFGHPPSDETLAQVIADIQRHDPSAVGVDLYRHIAYPPGGALLADQFREPNVVGIRFIGTDPSVGEVPAPPDLPRDRISFSDLVIDPDGVLRRALLYVDGEPGFFSFALRTVLVGLPTAAERFSVAEMALRFDEQTVPRLRNFAGGYADADNAGYQTLLRYRSRRQPAEVVSVSDVLDGRLRREQVASRIVLIGEVDASLSDQFYTPYSAALTDADFAMSAVFVQAQIISQLLDLIAGEPAQFRYFSRLGEFAWVAIWALLAALVTWSIRHPVVSLLSLPVVPVTIAVSGWFAISKLFWPPLVVAGLAAALASAIVTSERFLRRTTHDSVTGLRGREAFMRRLRNALAHSGSDPGLAVAFMGIDRLNVINKAMGHAAGDHLLARVSDRLRRGVDDERDVARVGGDEFAVLFRGLDAAAVAERIRTIRRMLAEPLQLDSRRLSVTASVGVAFAGSDVARQAEAVLRDAHTAMYRAKARKEVQLQIYSPDMGDQALARLDLESELLNAVRDHEFFLDYQPIIDLRSGALQGFEALLRWQSPARGLVGPEDFIPILEETGMIVPTGQWVLETACRQAAHWRAAFPRSNLKINVNLSVRQIIEPGLEDLVDRALSACQLPPDALQLEFTESMIMRDVASTHAQMSALRSMGVRLAIDDFGTGYSSLNYLHRFPVDTLKIDRAFIDQITDNEEDRNIVHTIIALGQRLGMTLIAEGIENEVQADTLRVAGCHGAQGFFYSRPLSTQQAGEWLASRSRDD
jgi:diguanylate cyclase (GGDEF)-like protein